MFSFLSAGSSSGFSFGCVAAFWDRNEALITGRMAVAETSLFLLDFPAPKYQRAVMFCPLEQENLLTVIFLPVFNYRSASHCLFFFLSLKHVALSDWSLLIPCPGGYSCFLFPEQFVDLPYMASLSSESCFDNRCCFTEQSTLYWETDWQVLCCTLCAAFLNFSCFANF